MSTKLEIKVFNDQVKKELEDANKKFPPFHSDHEGYALLLEEFEELVEEIRIARCRISNAWSNTKNGNSLKVQQELRELLTDLRKAYKELVQTAAMVQKWLDMYDAKPDWTNKETL